MKPEHLERLRQPFPPGDPRDPHHQLRDALGFGLPNSVALAGEILEDLSEEHFGIGWWRDHLQDRRRILISDQLALTAASIETNMVEARLHHLEAIDHLEEHGRRPSVRTFVDGVGNKDKVPVRPESAADRLHGQLATVHVVGFFRAIASALDCLGATTIGVAALRQRLLTAGLTQARNALAAVDAGAVAHVALRERLNEVLEAAGPEGWWEWTLNYRNMLVHRGRHLQLWVSRPTGGRVALPNGTDFIGENAVLWLSRDPSRGQVDSLRDDRDHYTLEEDARDTINGIWGSALRAVEETAGLLLALWRRRRAEPALLPQPEQQWPDVDLPPPRRFRGYGPPAPPQAGATMWSARAFHRRLRAAALDDAHRALWADPG